MAAQDQNQQIADLKGIIERLKRELDSLSRESGKAVKDLEQEVRRLKHRVDNLESQVGTLRR